MGKALIIGDIHLQVLSHIPRYSECQVESILRLIENERGAFDNLNYIIFLGDVFDKRKPDPSTLLLFQDLLDQIVLITNAEVIVIMGNHDAESKADNGITALSLFNISLVNKYNEWDLLPNLRCRFIPHYENEDKIRELLKDVKDDEWIFGHYGFTGCINAQGIYDFNLDPKTFKGNTVLGHIHKYAKHDPNITILGTPYHTSFHEAGKVNYYGILTDDGKLQIKEQVYGGPRYINVSLDDLSKLEGLDTEKYCNLVRIWLNPIKTGDHLDLISEVIKKYGVDWVDVKFIQLTDIKDDLSTYNPSMPVFNINEAIIKDYVEQSKSLIPYDVLMEGLREIED